MSRIVGRKEDISYGSVEHFFEERGGSALRHRYNYVMCLDDHPEVAVQRDMQAKAKIESQLDIREGMAVLDLGCGIGRWGELFCSLPCFLNAFGDGLRLKLDELMDFSDGLQKKREHVTLEHCVIWEAVQ